MNFLPEVRSAQPRDTQHLRDLDVKCFDYCWTEEDWAALDDEHSTVIVVAVYGTPVAMLVCDEQEFKGRKLLHIYKVCTKPNFRNKGFAKKLLARAYEIARMVNADALAISVPESMTRPDSPTNCVGWLNKMGFYADCILDEKERMYGREEDVILFVYNITL